MPTDIGLQLYTLREECSRDLPGTLQKVAAMGYPFVELYDNYGLDAPALRKLLSEHNLKAVSSHVALEKLEADLPGVIEYYQALDCRFLVCPYVAEERRRTAADYQNLGKILTAIGTTCNWAGIQFCYHNHNFEFESFDGQSGWQLLLESSDPRFVQAELDLYWVEYSGWDPGALLRQLQGRCPLIHLKDIGPDRSTVEFGEGLMDWADILRVARESGVRHFLIEQDATRRPALESVQISIDNYRRLQEK